MSNIGSTNIIGKQLKAVITTATESELKIFKNNDNTCAVKNTIIISVPQENGKDKEGGISIWLSDDNGKLIQKGYL